MKWWAVVRSVITAFFLTALVWQGVADYPGGQLWTVLSSQKTGYLWQYVILFLAWTLAMWWTLYWERKLNGSCPLCGCKIHV